MHEATRAILRKNRIPWLKVHNIEFSKHEDKCVLTRFGVRMWTCLWCSRISTAIDSLPCKYVRLPLGFRKPRRVEVQPIIDRLASKSKGWMGRLLAKPGRLALINSVLSSTTTYSLTMFAANPWAVKKMNKICGDFLWDIEKGVNGGGKCMVSSKQICKPKIVGGLSIKDMVAFN